jgi:ABC-type Fe3+/spermidine/putrescine transport system ATPase subunit
VTEHAVSLRDVSKQFGSHAALVGATLDVAPSECIVVLGPSGCGKTTLLRLIAGLEVPDAGEIWLRGVQVARTGHTLVPPHARHLGFVFQDLALWPHLTVRGNLRFVLDSLRVPAGERSRRMDDALRRVRVDALADRYPHQLAGGEQQRVALARALVGEPRVLLLDEPLSSLDTELRSALRAELARLQRALALTTVYVIHDHEDAAALADRVVEMRAGRIVAIKDNSPTQGRG